MVTTRKRNAPQSNETDDQTKLSKKQPTPKLKEIVEETTTPSERQADQSVEAVKPSKLSKTEAAESPKSRKASKNEGSGTSRKSQKSVVGDSECLLVGEPVLAEEARRRWPERYPSNENHQVNDDDADVLYARCHYEQAEVDGILFNLLDDAFIKGEDGKPNYIGRIVELFQSINKKPFFTAQWFFKVEDTVIKGRAHLIDEKRVFCSDLRDDNPLDCIISKIKIVQVPLNIDLLVTKASIPPCDFYYNMKYSMDYSTFSNISTENEQDGESLSTISSEGSCGGVLGEVNNGQEKFDKTMPQRSQMTMLDLYSGCGGMSTGLCLGAAISGVNLVTSWAVDMNQYACQSLKFNHPETEVRNESADDFLELLKKWQKLCEDFCSESLEQSNNSPQAIEEDNEDIDIGSEGQSEDFEVEKLVGICFGDPNDSNTPDLHFKVRWKGYDSNDDTWEPFNGLSNCEERIKDFIINGRKSKILPLPGDVDVICGGPPCQGISGFNRFRNVDEPLADPKNRQLEVYMDIVNHLKPKYVLMENVVDIVKFSGGYLGRHALSRLVAMNYQTRLGLLTAGCYGLPQFRMRVFIWGARPTEKLPQYPLPTHEVVVRGIFPTEFETNVVAFDEDATCVLERALLLEDAISDLPPVTNNETRDEIEYEKVAQTEFQKHIRLRKSDMLGINANAAKELQKDMLHDHRPLQLNEDDYQRVCRIPKRKGANFRDLPGVLVGLDNKVEWDTSIERVYLPSGKPLVPDYAMTFVKGSSSKPFGRLWWDEIVSTVVTRAEPHNQVILHPEQDRVLSIRENARLQGFPDYYKLFGPVKERYIQVGNAVAVPVARALGYALGVASQGKCNDQPLLTLPPHFPNYPSETIEAVDASN